MRATIHGTQAVFPGAVAKFYILQQPPPAAKPWTPKVCSACTAARDRTDNSRIKPAPLKIAGAGFLHLDRGGRGEQCSPAKQPRRPGKRAGDARPYRAAASGHIPKRGRGVNTHAANGYEPPRSSVPVQLLFSFPRVFRRKLHVCDYFPDLAQRPDFAEILLAQLARVT